MGRSGSRPLRPTVVPGGTPRGLAAVPWQMAGPSADASVCEGGCRWPSKETGVTPEASRPVTSRMSNSTTWVSGWSHPQDVPAQSCWSAVKAVVGGPKSRGGR
ncbi:hypothetical protein GCM10020229_83350 [Kitasatospora albolonga]